MTCSDMALQNTDTTAEWSMQLYNIVYYPDRNIKRTIIFTKMHEYNICVAFSMHG